MLTHHHIKGHRNDVFVVVVVVFQLPQMHLTPDALPDTAGVWREPGINPPTVGSLTTTAGPPAPWTPVQVVEITNRRSCKCSCYQLTPSRNNKKSNETIGQALTAEKHHSSHTL